MDVGTFRDKLESVKVSIQSKLIGYYANTYYTENQDGTITFKWDNINYAMRKESDKISNEELLALVMLFPNLYSSDEEQNMENIENKIAVVAIIISDKDAVEKVNELLHGFRDNIIGRMGLPHQRKDISVISIVMDAPQEKINSLSGKLGMMNGVTSKVLTTK